MTSRSRFLRRCHLGTLLSMIALSCSHSPTSGDSRTLSVLYTNDVPMVTDTPGTAIVTWLSPATVYSVQISSLPGCPTCRLYWYEPGFRKDTVQPHEHMCVHFVSPDTLVAPEIKDTAGSSSAITFAGRDSAINWSRATSWGFDGHFVLPAGSVDSAYGNQLVQGC